MAWQGSKILGPPISRVDALSAAKEFGTGNIDRDYSEDPYGGQFVRPPAPIPRSEWKARIAEIEAHGYTSELLLEEDWKIKNQFQTSLCWSFSTAGSIEANRIIAGDQYVSLSPASASGLNGYQDRGGYPTKAARMAADRGYVTSLLWPDTEINSKRDTDAANKSRARNRVTEWYDLPQGSFDHVFSALLRRQTCAVGLPWWGHAVKFCDPMWSEKYGYMVRFANSWGTGWGTHGWGVLTEKECEIGDATCPRVSMATGGE